MACSHQAGARCIPGGCWPLSRAFCPGLPSQPACDIPCRSPVPAARLAVQRSAAHGHSPPATQQVPGPGRAENCPQCACQPANAVVNQQAIAWHTPCTSICGIICSLCKLSWLSQAMQPSLVYACRCCSFSVICWPSRVPGVLHGVHLSLRFQPYQVLAPFQIQKGHLQGRVKLWKCSNCIFAAGSAGTVNLTWTSRLVSVWFGLWLLGLRYDLS